MVTPRLCYAFILFLALVSPFLCSSLIKQIPTAPPHSHKMRGCPVWYSGRLSRSGVGEYPYVGVKIILLLRQVCPVPIIPLTHRRLPVSAALASCGKGNRPVCVPAAESLCRNYFSYVPSVLLSAAVLLEKTFCPIPAAFSGVGTLPITSGQLVPKWPLDKVSRRGSLRCFPGRRFLFGQSFLFQGAVHRWTNLSLYLNDHPSCMS